MNGLVLHPVTKKQLEGFITVPAQAVMLVGPSGIGKSTLATYLAAKTLNLDSDFASYPYKLIIDSEDSRAIGIEAVRQLEHFLSLKVPRQSEYNRAVVIENAHTLTLEAQNALLKTLEEPPDHTLLILNTSYEQALLPTIRSRLQSLGVKRPEPTKLKEYFKKQGHDPQKIQQAMAISGGLPGLAHALLEEQDHPLLQATEQARQLLSSAPYERLLLVDNLSKQRELALGTAFILQQMAETALKSSEGAAAKRWQTVLEAGYDATVALNANAQPKLVLTKLCLSL